MLEAGNSQSEARTPGERRQVAPGEGRVGVQRARPGERERDRAQRAPADAQGQPPAGVEHQHVFERLPPGVAPPPGGRHRRHRQRVAGERHLAQAACAGKFVDGSRAALADKPPAQPAPCPDLLLLSLTPFQRECAGPPAGCASAEAELGHGRRVSGCAKSPATLHAAMGAHNQCGVFSPRA